MRPYEALNRSVLENGYNRNSVRPKYRAMIQSMFLLFNVLWSWHGGAVAIRIGRSESNLGITKNFFRSYSIYLYNYLYPDNLRAVTSANVKRYFFVESNLEAPPIEGPIF